VLDGKLLIGTQTSVNNIPTSNKTEYMTTNVYFSLAKMLKAFLKRYHAMTSCHNVSTHTWIH